MQTYDNSVVLVFQILIVYAKDVSINCTGVVKDILKLYYGHLSTSIVLLRCQWAKQIDSPGNPTYTRNDVSFFVMNV